VAEHSVRDQDSTEFYEVVTSEAFTLPAVVPIRGADGELIPHATAEVYLGDDGSLMAVIRIPGMSKVTAILQDRDHLSVSFK
jgi:hypothetical protein